MSQKNVSSSFQGRNLEEHSRSWLSHGDTELELLLEKIERSEAWCMSADTTPELRERLEDLISYCRLPALPHEEIEARTAIFVLSHLHTSFCIYLLVIISQRNRNFISSLVEHSKKLDTEADIILERISIPYVHQYVKHIFSEETAEYIAGFTERQNAGDL